MSVRKVEELLQARMTSDGAGVRLMRVFGGNDLTRFDPFLMMDEFGSDQPGDYAGGFPSHPHRGFETITYMLEGHMEHQDHMGNVGDLQSGGVQWMTAGAGIIHSEMPRQKQGRLRGFQVWLNLPAREKMQTASYRDLAAESIPSYELPGIRIKAIAGELHTDQHVLKGAVSKAVTEPAYLDIVFDGPVQTLSLDIPDEHTVLVYVYEGAVDIGEGESTTRAGKTRMARLSSRGAVKLTASAGARALVLSGKPLREPIVHYGPFVMNTREEIEQALQDYQAGKLTG